MTFDFARHMEEIAAWYRAILTGLYPDGPDRDAKEVVLIHRDQFARLAE
ncbi:hypothetical protein [Streptomyces sp. NPDC050485]